MDGMTLRWVSLLWLCACLPFAALATVPTPVHEARQGPIFTESVVQPLSTDPGPVSLQTSSSTSTSTTPEDTTMAPTSTSSEQSFSPSSSVSPSPLTTSSNTPVQSSQTSSQTSTALVTSSSVSPSATSSATPQPSSSPGILNFTVHNMTTCTSGLISWNYSRNEADLLLSVTNIGVDQRYDLSRSEKRQTLVDGTILQQLVDTNTTASPWSWSSVNITQGWYEIQGLVLATPNVSSTSEPFFVANGTDVTCLTSTSPASSGVSASPSSSVASRKNVAGIVGGVVGAVVGVALAVIAGVCLWSRRRKRPFIVGRRKNQQWGSLKSADSNVRPGESGNQPTSNRSHAHSESAAAVLEDVAGMDGSLATTPAGSDEDAIIMGEEKLVSPASSSGMSPLDTLNTPVHYYPAQIPTPAATESSRSRSVSAHTSNQSIEQQSQRIRSSMEISTRRRNERLSMPTLPPPSLSRLPHTPTHSQYKEEYPLSPVTATSVNRSVSTGAISVTARRTSRKPVPQYDPSALLEDTNTDSVSTFTAGAESSQSHGTGMGTGAFGTPAGLVHKASFGDGRPVHYLIPDMPPPQQD